MKNKSGLRKVVKTVRGKHGSYRRAYNVKSGGPMSTGQFLRKHGKAWAATNAATGVAGGVGAMLAHKHSRNPRSGNGAFAGYAVAGLGAAIGLGSTKRMRALERDSRRLSLGGRVVMAGIGMTSHIAGAAAGLYGASKVLRPRSINRPQSSSSNVASVRVERTRGGAFRASGRHDTPGTLNNWRRLT